MGADRGCRGAGAADPGDAGAGGAGPPVYGPHRGRECHQHAGDRGVIVLSGQGVITVNNNRQEFKAGDSFFVTAGHKNVRISGNCDVIVTRV